MAVMRLQTFGGEMPLLDATLLPATGAESAYNARLNDGILTPVRKSSETGFSAADASHKTIYRHGDEWISFANEVWAANGPVAQDRLYYTGDGAPKMRISGVVYPLAIATPSVALSATATGTGSGDVQSRTYCYTWVSDFGEESAPSPASSLIDWQPGQTVTLSGFGTTPTGRSISKQRIYRSQTGSAGTYFYLIAERAASTSDFTDSVAVDAIQEVLPSSDWTPPPDELSGLISMPNGIMAAFVGATLYFCEPYRPHAWPEKYTIQVDKNIVGLSAIGPVLIVMTTGQPYLIAGSHPDSMQQEKIRAPFACINSRSIVNLGFGVAYATNEGLVLIKPDGSVTLATEQLFSREQWLALAPADVICGQFGGIYVMFYDIVDDVGTRTTEALQINVNSAQSLARSSEKADAVFYDIEESGLYFKRPGETSIQKFDAPGRPRELMYWRSKQFMTIEPTTFGAILVDTKTLVDEAEIAAEIAAVVAANDALLASSIGSDINGSEINALPLAGDILAPIPNFGTFVVNVYADDILVRSVKTSGEIKRLPSKRKARKWQVDVSSTVPVRQITLAGTIEELKGQ